jgi:hypothetical protein
MTSPPTRSSTFSFLEHSPGYVTGAQQTNTSLLSCRELTGCWARFTWRLTHKQCISTSFFSFFHANFDILLPFHTGFSRTSPTHSYHCRFVFSKHRYRFMARRGNISIQAFSVFLPPPPPPRKMPLNRPRFCPYTIISRHSQAPCNSLLSRYAILRIDCESILHRSTSVP